MTSVKLWVSIICMFWSMVGCSQVPSALIISPYAGMDRVRFNPALGISSAYQWDATLVGGHLFAKTDYGFLRSANLINFINRSSDALLIDARTDIPESSDRPIVIFDEDGGSKSFFLSGLINGPSFSFALGDQTRVGLFSNIRLHASSTSIPENFGIYELNQSYQTDIVNLEQGVASFASWIEIGGHLSKRIDELSFGVNIKLLRPTEGGYINSKGSAQYNFIDSILTIANPPAIELAYTTSSINSNSLQTDINGGGIGLDIGVAYHSDFWSAGASITDIGALRYKTNVEIYTTELLSALTEIRTQDYRDFSTLRDLIDQFQNDQNLMPDNFGVFSVGLPTRLSLFGDYSYDERISVSGVINQRLPLFPNSLAANNSLVVTPRYETSLFSYYLPITLLEYSSVSIGSAVRIGPLTIGTDHLPSVFINSDFNGSDLYFNLKIYPFNQKGRTGKGSNVLCPMF